MTVVLTGFPDVADALAEWLPRQRWFGGKGRRVGEVRLRVVAEFLDRSATGGPRGVFAIAEVRLGVEVQRYHLLLGLRPAGDPVPAGSLISTVGGSSIYDGAADEAFARELLMLIGTDSTRDGIRFRTEPAGERAGLARRDLRSRPAGVEQSNTSLVLGERFILKLFRRHTTGVNPDVELHRALGGAGSTRIAPLLGVIEGELDGAPVTFGMLQSFRANAVEGWSAATDNIGALLAGRTTTDFAARAGSLGRAVAEVHTDLASALGTARLPAAGLLRLSSEFLARFDAVQDAISASPDIAGRLAPHVQRIRQAFTAVADLPSGVSVQRVHGDLHLGQVLHAQDRWLLIDFEGEPAATVARRRAPHSPLRDVAGMLRSFDYAANQARLDDGDEAGAAISTAWLDRARAAFCAGYADAAGAHPGELAPLLLAYELDKALYEVQYELRNRPKWARIPLAATERLITNSVA